MLIGKVQKLQELVTPDKTAKAMGSGSLEVYATPAMVALMEKTCCACIAQDLLPGQSTVGTLVDMAHTSATPMGRQVSCEAKLEWEQERKLGFGVVVRDESGVIGEGRHERFVVEEQRFMTKALNKAR